MTRPTFSGFLILFLLSAVFCTGSYANQKLTCESPSGKISMFFYLEDDGQARYGIIYQQDTLIKPSSLGFILKEKDSLMQFRLLGSKVQGSNTVWNPVWGITSQIEDHYNELIVELETGKKQRLNIYFRCYDDGCAYRYEFPGKAGDSLVIVSEESRMTFAGSYDCWWSWADYNTLEKEFYHTLLDSTSHVALPFTLKKQNGPYLCIHEAAIDHYSTMTLKRCESGKPVFKVNLVPWADGPLVKTTLPAKSPWRVFFIADKAGDLMESNLLLNLNDPCVLNDVSWIQPMTYVGIWWEMHLGISAWDTKWKHGATTENAKRYIDFAAKHKIGGFLAEGWNTGWEHWGETGAFDFVTPYPDFDLKAVAAYAKSKSIMMIGHHETGGDTYSYEKHIDSAFSLYKQLGIRAVKTGYAGPVVPVGEYHHGQCMVEHYNRVMRKAAEYGLMLDVHEPVILSGLSRTYPNLMTAEGVRGMEWNAWSKGNSPSHTCTLPFTRGMAGPMDYTPGIFDINLSAHAKERKKWNALDEGNTAVHSTISNQLALMIVLYSPLQMAADLPENYENHPALQLIEGMPASWDESRVLEASIGEYIIIARCKGNIWYLAGVNNETSRDFSLSLDFLQQGKLYQCLLCKDAANAHYETNSEAYIMQEQTNNCADRAEVHMAAGGGFLMRFTMKP